jgi:release factor glutamine methyltransferase
VIALLESGEIGSAQAEARWIVEAATRPSGDVSRKRAMSLARRRVDGEPLQYITGVAGFRTLELAVGPGVLVPRPETEIVTECALSLLPRSGFLVDIGTGSGAIALAVKAERADARVMATELSDDAMIWATRNRARLGLAVELLHGDLFDPLPREVSGEVDVVVSNPPYIADGEIGNLPCDVVDHEPHVALFAGPEGLTIVARVIDGASEWLRPGGHLVVEIGADQGVAVETMMKRFGYRDVEIKRDLADRDRIGIGLWT